MDLQSRAFRESGPDDWDVNVPTDAPTGPIYTPDDWDDDDWDADAAGPKTLEQARTALAERVAGYAPDDDATAYDDLTEDEPTAGDIPRGAGLWVPWLADAARSSGLPVVEVNGWRTRGHGPMRVIEGVVGHHTATGDAAKGDYPSLGIVTNGRAGLPGPLCNFGLGRNGTIYVVAAGCAYHAGASRWAGFVDLNDEMLGIEAEDNGDGHWTAAMLDAYPRLVAALLTYMRRGVDRYISHRGCAVPPGRKPDPGGLSDQWMRDQVTRVLSGAAPSPAAPARPVVEEDVMFIKCQPKGRGEMTALLSGPMFVGLVGNEAGGAQQLADKGQAALLWVEEATWNELDRRSHALCDSPHKVQNVTAPPPA